MDRYKNQNIKSYSLVNWCILFLCPLLSVPLILLGVWNKNKDAVCQLIVFFCILAFLFPPSGDLYRYYDIYYKNFKGINYLDIFDFYVFDIGWYSILYVFVNNNIPFQYSQVLSCIIQLSIGFFFLIKFKIFRLNNRNAFYLVISSFIYNGFWIPIEVRFYIALSFFMLSAYYVSLNKFRITILMLLLSIAIHFSFVIMAFILILSCIFQRYINLKFCVIIGIVVLSIISMVGLYLDELGFSKAVYITQNTDWTETASPLLRFVRRWILYIPLFVLTLFLLKSNLQNQFKKLSLVFITLSIATFQMPDLSNRLIMISMATSWLCFLSEMQIRRDTKWIKRFFYSSLVAFFTCTAISNRALRLGSYGDIVYPIPYILFNDIYKDAWIQAHINNGNVFKLE